MEFHINKDANIARNLFEFGLKSHLEEPAFVMKYIEFLTHLNDDNNLRVLFEKVLSKITVEKASAIWEAFMNFEYTSGDLNSITKVEKRRATAHPENESFTGIQALVQRYSFMDLLPCTTAELETFGGKREVQKGGNNELTSSSNINGSGIKFARPDLTSMLIYRPDMGLTGNPKAPAVSNTTTGIVQPILVSTQANLYLNFPEILAKLLAALPSPNVYQGAPTLDVDQLITLIQDTPIPNAPAPRTTDKNKSGKRKTADSDSEDEEEEKGVKNKPPTNDAYRNRQAAKLARTHKV